MKEIFNLYSRTFIQEFSRPDDLIIWTEVWNGELYYSQAFEELVETYYFMN